MVVGSGPSLPFNPEIQVVIACNALCMSTGILVPNLSSNCLSVNSMDLPVIASQLLRSPCLSNSSLAPVVPAFGWFAFFWTLFLLGFCSICVRLLGVLILLLLCAGAPLFSYINNVVQFIVATAVLVREATVGFEHGEFLGFACR